jgi:hypothetical protein
MGKGERGKGKGERGKGKGERGKGKGEGGKEKGERGERGGREGAYIVNRVSMTSTGDRGTIEMAKVTHLQANPGNA